MYTRKILSGSSHGGAIALGVVAVTIHTGPALNDGISHDAVFLWCFNVDSSDHQLTLTIAGTLCTYQATIKANSIMQLVMPGLPIDNSGTIQGAADANNFLGIVGYVYNVNY